MRIVGWQEFQALPQGTIYQEYAEGNLGEPMVFGGMQHGIPDYAEAALLPQATWGSSLERGHRLEHVDELVAHPTGFGRNGMFDHESDRWLVWEKEDRERVARWLLNSEICLSAMNEDDAFCVVEPVLAALAESAA